MKLLLPRNELKDALTGLTKVVNTRASLPILSHVRLDAGRNIRLTGTDLDQTLTYTLNGSTPVTEPVTSLIPIEALLSLVKTSQGPDIEIETTGQNEVHLGSSVGNQVIRRRVNTPDLDEWPSLPEPVKTKPVEPKLLDHIRQALPFASTEDSRFTLKGVYLDVSNKRCHKVVATDGRRLTAFNSVRLPLAESVIVPSSKFLAWNKLTGEPSIGADKERELFTLHVGPWSYTTKLTSGSYPNYQQVIPSGPVSNTLELSPEDSELLIKALPSLPGHNGCKDTVILCLSSGNARVFTRESRDTAENSIKLENSTVTGSITIGVNRHFLREALSVGFCIFEMTDNRCPLVGKLSREDKYSVHVLMPMRTADTEVPVSSQPDSAPAAPADTPVAPPEQVHNTQPKEKVMPKKEDTQATTEVSSFDKILSAYEVARTAVRDANAALSAVAEAIKEAVKEDKARRREIADVRAGLAKLQSIKV